MSRLTEITDDLLALDALLDERGGDVSDPEIEAQIDAWFAEFEGAFDEKIDAYVGYIRELQKAAENVRTEYRRLRDRAQNFDARVVSLKGRLLGAMTTLGRSKVRTDRNTVYLATDGGKQRLEIDRDKTPITYWRPGPPELDEKRIRTELEAGQELDFARLLPRGCHVAIR